MPTAVPQVAPNVTAGVAHFFDFAALYNRLVNEAPVGAWLVEVGVFHGMSLRHLAHAAKAVDRNLTVVGVDWMRGSPELADHLATLPHGNLAGSALHTLVTAGVADDCTLIVAPSVRAAKFVPDGSCHMVFIDGDHGYESVRADLRAWAPKVMPGGSVCGHDYFTHSSVREAVHEFFGQRDLLSRDCDTCWEVRL